MGLAPIATTLILAHLCELRAAYFRRLRARDEQHRSLHDREVTLEDAVDRELTHARPSEDETTFRSPPQPDWQPGAPTCQPEG